MSHELRIESLPSGIAVAECSCGAWHMRAGADALSVRHETPQDLLGRNHRRHVRETG